MTKTFALILHLVFVDGTSYTHIDDSGLSGSECAARLVAFQVMQIAPLPGVPFKGARVLDGVVVECKEEHAV